MGSRGNRQWYKAPASPSMSLCGQPPGLGVPLPSGPPTPPPCNEMVPQSPEVPPADEEQKHKPPFPWGTPQTSWVPGAGVGSHHLLWPPAWCRSLSSLTHPLMPPPPASPRPSAGGPAGDRSRRGTSLPLPSLPSPRPSLIGAFCSQRVTPAAGGERDVEGGGEAASGPAVSGEGQQPQSPGPSPRQAPSTWR